MDAKRLRMECLNLAVRHWIGDGKYIKDAINVAKGFEEYVSGKDCVDMSPMWQSNADKLRIQGERTSDIWTTPNEDRETRTLDETKAAPGEPLLRKSAWWTPEDDCRDLSVPDMIRRIYRRKSMAVAPNGHTCPFITLEEWCRIYDWVQDGAKMP